MLHSWLVHSSMNCTRSSTTELSDQLPRHSSELGGKSLTLYTDYSVTTLIGGSVTNHAGRYRRRGTQECVRHIRQAANVKLFWRWPLGTVQKSLRSCHICQSANVKMFLRWPLDELDRRILLP